MSLVAGTRLGPYEIQSAIGAGGMGEVYKARDTRLDRTVAIKVLPPDVSADPERRARFEREAKTIASLNHPHVCVLHDVGRENGVDYLVLEYLEGETLAHRLERVGGRTPSPGSGSPAGNVDVQTPATRRRSPELTLEEIVRIGTELADAVAAAHKAGIIHRDLKPGNVILTTSGVKVLDFDLARLHGVGVAAGAGESRLTTHAIDPLTDAGTRLGTVPYMAPEQVEGREADARSDVFALGAILYEMATGRRAFEGPTSASVAAAILDRDPPPVGSLRPLTPPAFDHVVATCLAKEPDARWQTARDLARELRWIGDQSCGGPSTAGAGVQPRGHRLVYLVLAAGLAGTVSGIAAWWWWSRPAETLGPAHLVRLFSSPGDYRGLALSPDGRQLAFAWNGGEDVENSDIYVKRVGDVDAARLTRTAEIEVLPCWSPDGERIAFLRRASDGHWAVFAMSSLGNDERKIADVPGSSSMSWSPDGRWLAISREKAIYALPLAGGDPVRLTSPTSPAYDYSPAFSWDGRSLAFIRATSFFARDIFIQPLTREGSAEGLPRQITQRGEEFSKLAWHRDGKSIVFSGMPVLFLRCLYRLPVDGSAAPERIEMAEPASDSPSTSPASNRLAFVQWSEMHDIFRVGGDRRSQPFVSTSLHEAGVNLSRDGSRVAFDSNRNGETVEVWTANADGSNQTQLTHGPARNQHSPRWSPDGRQLVFVSRGRDEKSDIYTIASDGGQPRRLTSEPSEELLPSWSADGQWVYFRSGRGGKHYIWRVRLSGGRWEQVTSGGDEWLALESLDGKTLYYTSSASTSSTSLMARPSQGGPEQRLIDFLSRTDFAVAEKGIYYWGRGDGATLPLMFFAFASRTSGEVLRVQPGQAMSVTASPDGKTVLYATTQGRSFPQLMVIENFR